jgi:hypothetical protein
MEFIFKIDCFFIEFKYKQVNARVYFDYIQSVNTSTYVMPGIS